jgi:predicted deacylase
MKTSLAFLFLLMGCFTFWAQADIPIHDSLNLDAFEKNAKHKIYLNVGQDALGNTLKLPVLIAKGSSGGPVLGLTAAIHGNELNGIKIIHDVFHTLDVSKVKGTLVAVPGLNSLGITMNQREYVDGTDLNRIFPGKVKGNRAEQLVHQIATKVIPLFEYHVDLHTASFGRINTLYGRGDMNDPQLAQMLQVLQPDIVVSNKGQASFGNSQAVTLRAYATSLGIKSVTMEYGNPQVFQNEMIERGITGLNNVLVHLKMIEGEIDLPEIQNICSKSYWMYTTQGGFLEILVDLGEKFQKGKKIAVLKDSFGQVVEEYFAPEGGIVVGKSTNPVSMSGSRIIHLGVLAKP